MAADRADAVVDVYVNEREARKWGARDGTPSDIQSFAESFAGWKAESSRKFSGLDIEKLLRRIRDGKTHLSVIGYNEFPYKKTGQIEREYWLAVDDGLIVLHVHYADKWHDKLEERGKCDVITQINLRHTVKHEAAVPGVNAYWTKCEDLDQWKELKGQPIFTGIPAQGWRWRQKVSGSWDNGFAPVVHDLLKEAEKCTMWVRAIKAVELAISPGTRKALCIGVEEYAAVDKLRNAVQDAVCLKSKLQEMCWSVDIVYNPGQRAFKEAIEKFADMVEKSSDACLFAFVGHGVELQGEHFFLPADFELRKRYRTESLLLQDLKDKAVAFSYLEECVQAVRQKPSALQVSLFVLDCCRSSISALVGDTSRTLSSFPQRGGQSLRSSTTIENSFVIYSTSKGSTAGDGAAGRGGPFMGIFTEEMMVPGSIQEVMMRTRTRLLADECQLSPEQSTLTTGFSFCPITNSSAAAASQGSDIDADLVDLLTKWGLQPEADRIAGLGVREPADMEYLTEDDIDDLGLLPVATRKFKAKLRIFKEAIAKKLIEADLSGQSTDEAGSESEGEIECASTGFAAGHMMAAYSPDNVKQFSSNATKFVDEVHATAKMWLGSEGGGKERRHPLCAAVLLDVLRDTRFKQNKDIDFANEWYWKCAHGDMCLSEDILEGFQSVFERGMPPPELIRAEASSGNTKQHQLCISLLDAAVRLLHQRSLWDDVAEWNQDVVDGWFTTSEGAVSFLDKAEAYLRRYAEPEKLNLKVMKGAVETGSFVAFFLADRFTQMLVFSVVEYRRASGMARHSGIDAERSSAGDGTLGGFVFFASSTGRACDLRGGGARCQLRGSPAVVAMLQFMTSLPISQSMLVGGDADQGSVLPTHAAADNEHLKQGGASNAFKVSRMGVLAPQADSDTSPAVGAVLYEAAASSVEAAPVPVEVSEGKGKGSKDTDAWPGDDDEAGGPAKQKPIAKDVLGEFGGMPEDHFIGEVDPDLKCIICHCVMVEPRSCREGHVYCLRCILRWLAQKKNCPGDREPLTESELTNLRPLQRQIERLPMRCPTAVKIQVGGMASKCQWEGVLAEREGHLKECRHALGDFDLEDGSTPLLAALSGHAEAARALVEAGADKEAKDKGGRTLAEAARALVPRLVSWASVWRTTVKVKFLAVAPVLEEVQPGRKIIFRVYVLEATKADDVARDFEERKLRVGAEASHITGCVVAKFESEVDPPAPHKFFFDIKYQPAPAGGQRLEEKKKQPIACGQVEPCMVPLTSSERKETKPRIYAFFSACPDDDLQLRQEAKKQVAAVHSASQLEYEVSPFDFRTFDDFFEHMMLATSRNTKIVHFSGHGGEKGGLRFLQTADRSKEESLETIADVFGCQAKGKDRSPGSVECAVLNACDTEQLGNAIMERGVPNVLCWRGKVPDKAATIFAHWFYTSLTSQRQLLMSQRHTQRSNVNVYEVAYKAARIEVKRWREENGMSAPVEVATVDEEGHRRGRSGVEPKALPAHQAWDLIFIAGTADGFHAAPKSDARELESPDGVGCFTSEEDGSDGAKRSATNRKGEAELQAFEALGVDLVFPTNITPPSKIRDNVRKYLDGMLRTEQLAKFGLEETEYEYPDPRRKNLKLTHLRLTPPALQSLFQPEKLECRPIRSYSDVFAEDGALMHLARMAKPGARRKARQMLGESLQLRERDLRNPTPSAGFDGHYRMAVAIKECWDHLGELDTGTVVYR